MRHALSQRGYDEFIRMVSWFFRNRANTSDHYHREFLVTLLDLGAWLRCEALFWRHWLSMVTEMPQIYPQRNQLKHTRKRYRVRNWNEYETGLRRRGDLTIWFAEDGLQDWSPAARKRPGDSSAILMRPLRQL